MSIRVDFESDDSRLQKALERLQRELDKAAQRSQKMADVSKKGSAEAQRAAAEHTAAQVGVQQQFQRVAAEVDKLNRKQRQAANDANTFGGRLRNAFDEGTAGVGRMVAGYISLNAVWSAGNALLQDRIDLQEKASQAQITEAGAQAKLLRNLPDSEAPAVLAEVDRISRETGVSKRIVNVVASEAVSAKGALTVDEAMGAVRQAVRVAPEDEAEATAIAGGLLDVASATGERDPRKNLGALLAIQEESRVKKLESIGQHMVPAFGGVRERGDSFTDAAALVTAFTNVLKDVEGRMSGTGALQLAKQLDEFLPEGDKFGENQFGRRVRIRQGTGLKSTAERIEFLQANPQMAEKFLATASFEAKVDPFARALVQKPDSEVARNFEDLRRRLPTADEAAPIADAKIRRMESIGIQRTADYDRTLNQAAEDLLTANIAEAEKGVSAQGLDKVLQGMERNIFARLATRFTYFYRTELFGEDPRKAFTDTLGEDLSTGDVEPAARQKVEDLIGRLRAKASPDELQPLPPRRLRDLPEFHYTGPAIGEAQPRRVFREQEIDMGPTRQERRGDALGTRPAADEGAAVSPVTFRGGRENELKPLLQELVEINRRSGETLANIAGNAPRSRDALAVARAAAGDRQRHTEG